MSVANGPYSVDVLEDADAFVDTLMSQIGAKISASKKVILGGREQPVSVLLGELMLVHDREIKKYNRGLPSSEKIATIRNEVLGSAVEKRLRTSWAQHLDTKNIGLKHVPSLEQTQLRLFIQASAENPGPMEEHALAHWLWQVKRKMLGLPVEDHIMLVFTGRQGCGKSSALSRLLESVNEYRCDMPISALADERNYVALSENFVILSDEMQGCQKTDIEHLKQIVTATRLSSRKLYTQLRETFPQNVSLIGTSNKSIDLLVRDETGMRRFFEINCLEKMDWSTINSIKYDELWQSIDETIPNGYLHLVKDEIRERQEKYRYKDSVETYIEELGVISGPLIEHTTVREIYNDYGRWCIDNGFKAFDKNYFGKRMSSLGVESARTNSTRGYKTARFKLWIDRAQASDHSAMMKEIDEIEKSMGIDPGPAISIK